MLGITASTLNFFVASKKWDLYNEANSVHSINKASKHSILGFDALKGGAKSHYFQGFLLKGTKNDQWEKAGTGQAKIRSSNG